ncbi:MAG: hypothetical protein K2L91_07495 [Duncaniella sp.]|nr:hypothetical protein [Duncaniella sp.]MDE6328354.1 hypothetical protein [Duncaniella sp.]MDE6466857.1 hypothetical protein [Duncaniella sp.]
MSAPAVSHAFTIGGDNGVALHGSVQADVLFPQEDETINTGKYDKDILFNTYADLNMISRYVDAGVRLEFMKWPLPGYEPDFAGWGVPNIYVKGRYKGFELTAGDFYEQFGSGFILRTYQERALGIDNSIRGGRLKINALRGFNFTLLGGLQRRYWDWKKQSQVYGGDMEINFSELSKSLSDRGIGWTFGASYVLKHENDEDKAISGTDYRLNLPKSVGAFDLRTNFRKGNFGVLGEFAWKGQDPSEDNGYTYGKGTAVMLSGSYSRSGMSVLLQAKRSENMAFRSQRSMSGTSAFLNNMPAFAYQHTYSLPALYPYATQAAPGEWAFQGSFAYTFKRKTPLGGKYGTKVKINASYIRGLDRKAPAPLLGNTIMGTDGYSSSFFKMGGEYYHDFNIQIEKKLSRSYNLSFMYMNQMANNDVLKISEVDNTHKIRTNIFVLDGKWSIDRRYTLRTELQYLTTRQDQKDWVYGLVELSVAPYLMFTLSDMWNCGDTGTHYYMGGITGNYRSNRLMLSYGRTREGFNCSGGVCRKVPSTHGFQIAYTYNF